MNPGLTKNYNSGAAVLARRFVKHGASDDAVIQAAASTDSIMGVSDDLGASAASESLDVYHSGIVEVDFGGTITRGQQITSDSAGKAVVAVDGDRAGGVAMVSGVSGDIGSVLLAPSTVSIPPVEAG